MAPDPSASDEKPRGLPTSSRLESWKEIAAYLRRGLTTVQRWEKSEGLPVHRHVHARLGSIWADRAEIDAWWAQRGSGLEKDEATAAAPQRLRRGWLAAALLAGLLGAVGLYSLARRPTGVVGGNGRIMVAVLPFIELGSAPDQAYFSDGLTDETIAELARIRPDLLGVIARTSAMQYKKSRKGIREIARELDVEYLLEGAVKRSAAAVRVDARLIRAADQSQLFSQTYERGLGDAAAIQGEIGRRVAKALALELLPLQEARLARSTPRDPKALLAHLKGLELLNQRTGDDIYRAVASFDEAVRLEPGYANAFAGRGLAYALLPTYGEFLPRDYYPKARASAEKALKLDPTLADAHAILGVVAHEYEWDHVRAEREYREALRQNPSSVLAHQTYAELLTHMGRIDEALGQIREAQRLDPHSRIVDSLRGWVLYYGRRYDEAIEHLSHVAAANPDFIPAHSYLGWAYDRKGMKAEAQAQYDLVRSLSRDNTPPYNWDFGTGGRRLEELEARARKGSFSPYELACLYAAAGRKDDSLRWLEVASESRDPSVVIMRVDPELDPIRQDARFEALLRRVGLASASKPGSVAKLQCKAGPSGVHAKMPPSMRLRWLAPLWLALVAGGMAAAQDTDPVYQKSSTSNTQFRLDAVLRQEWTKDIWVSETETRDEDRWRIQARPRVEFGTRSFAVGVGGEFNYSSDDNTIIVDPVTLQETKPPLLRDNYKSKEARLDLAFARVEPVHWLRLEGGRFVMPVAVTEMMWDRDLRPQGGALTLQSKNANGVSRFSVTGLYATGSHVFEDTDANMIMASAQATFPGAQDSSFQLVGSYIDWQKPNNLEPMIRRQNTRVNGLIVHDYHVIDFVARVKQGGNMPVEIVANMSWNTAVKDKGQGIWLAGALGGKQSRIRAEYTYATVDRDATLAAYDADDFFWGTGWKGHRLDLGSETSDKTSIHVVGQLMQFKDSTDPAERDHYDRRLRLEVRVHY